MLISSNYEAFLPLYLSRRQPNRPISITDAATAAISTNNKTNTAVAAAHITATVTGGDDEHDIFNIMRKAKGAPRKCQSPFQSARCETDNSTSDSYSETKHSKRDK